MTRDGLPFFATLCQGGSPRGLRNLRGGFAAPGGFLDGARDLEELGLGVTDFGCLCAGDFGVLTGGEQLPRAGVIGDLTFEELLSDVAPMFRVFDGEHDFDSVVEVPWHEVGACDVEVRFAVVMEEVDAAVFEKPADDGANADVLAESGHAGAQAADASNDEVDLNAGFGCLVKRFDEGGIHEAIHFRDDTRWFAGFGVCGFVFHQPEEFRCHGVWRDQQLSCAAETAGRTGETVEQVSDVFTECGVRSEEG